jgi:hypothetical protein
LKNLLAAGKLDILIDQDEELVNLHNKELSLACKEKFTKIVQLLSMTSQQNFNVMQFINGLSSIQLKKILIYYLKSNHMMN